jgi:hypothetical protein
VAAAAAHTWSNIYTRQRASPPRARSSRTNRL